jgi:thiamine biosynthesis lipoprotein
LTVGVLVGVGLWQTAGRPSRSHIDVVGQPTRVMGTSCTLAAVARPGERTRAEKALREAEGVLRSVEARMSTWLADSEVSRLNAAGAGERTPLSAETLEVLRAARQAARQTHRAFDVTCRPLVELWRRAGDEGTAPTDEQCDDARAASNWELIELEDSGATKHGADARVDLGGIAKGYAIDRALAVLRRGGLAGGMVEVGGDLACFGRRADGRDWAVDVKDPFGPGRLVKVKLRDGAVATSGDYARYVQIGGKRYGHVIDPRTGRPADAAASVTVAAPTAMTADVWATALSVLGPEGLGRLPEGVEALMVVGSEDAYQIFSTAGFLNLLEEPLPEGLTVWKAE